VFVRAVVAVVVSVADPRVADAASVAAGELVAVTRSVGMTADVGRFITAVRAIRLTVAVPPRRDAAVRRGAAEIICRNKHTKILVISIPGLRNFYFQNPEIPFSGLGLQSDRYFGSPR